MTGRGRAPERLKLIVMADLHLVPPGETSHGLDTAERLRLAVSHVDAEHPDADLCVLAGDLADRGEAAAYAVLGEALEGLRVPWRLTLGNHDDRPTFLAAFPDLAEPATGCVDFALDLRGHRLVVLDSSEPGVVEGVLAAAQLDWLAERLEEGRDRPAIVVLHHHAAPLSLPVDRIRLREPEVFAAVLARHPDLRQVIAGHVHLPSAATWMGVPFVTHGGGHYAVAPGPGEATLRLEGPGQYALVLSDGQGTTTRFVDFIDANAPLPAGQAAEREAPAPAP